MEISKGVELPFRIRVEAANVIVRETGIKYASHIEHYAGTTLLMALMGLGIVGLE